MRDSKTGAEAGTRSARGAYLEKLRVNARINGEAAPGYATIAKAMGISKTTVYNWFRYDKTIDAANIVHLANVLADNPEDAKAIEARLSVFREPDGDDDRFDLHSLFDRVEAERKVRITFVDYPPVAKPGDRNNFLRKLIQLFAGSAGLQWHEQPQTAGDDLTDLCDGIRNGSLDLACGLMMTPDRQRKVHFLPIPLRLPLDAVVVTEDLTSDAMRTPGWARVGLQEARPNDLTGRLREFSRLLLDPSHLAQDDAADEFTQLMTPVVRTGEIGNGYAEHFLGFDEKVPGHTPVFAAEYSPKAYAEALLAADRRFGLPVMFADVLACLHTVRHLTHTYRKPARLLFSSPSPTMGFDGTAARLVDGGLDIAPPAYFVGIACDREDEKFIAYLTSAFETFLDTYPDQIASLYVGLYVELCATTNGVIDRHEDVVRRWMGLPDLAKAKVGAQEDARAKGAAPDDRLSAEALQFQRHTSSSALRPWRLILWRAAERIRDQEEMAGQESSMATFKGSKR